MTKKLSLLPAVLKHLAKASERLTDDEIADVAAGRRRIVVTTEEVEQSHFTEPADALPDFDSLIGGLKAADTRHAANGLLEDAALTRSQLHKLAKALDLPVQRSDDVVRLREKIIETTIGFRLTSNAIHRNA